MEVRMWTAVRQLSNYAIERHHLDYTVKKLAYNNQDWENLTFTVFYFSKLL